jgi:hypothetical protein
MAHVIPAGAVGGWLAALVGKRLLKMAVKRLVQKFR